MLVSKAAAGSTPYAAFSARTSCARAVISLGLMDAVSTGGRVAGSGPCDRPTDLVPRYARSVPPCSAPTAATTEARTAEMSSAVRVRSVARSRTVIATDFRPAPTCSPR